MENNYIPELSKGEYAYIQDQTGVSLKKIALAAGIKSASVVNVWMRPNKPWRRKNDIKPRYVKALMTAINDSGLFDSARRKWRDLTDEERKNYIKRRYFLSSDPREEDIF